MRALAVPLLACIALSGCASTHVQLTASPGDAEIVVDGEPKGKGTARLDVGPEYDFPRSYRVKISRPGYTSVESTIANKPNYTAIGAALLVDALFAYWAFSNVPTSDRQMRSFYATFGTLQLLSMPVALFNRNQFEKQYEFKLEPDASAAQ